MTPNADAYLKRENKWRRLTPLSVVTNLITNFLGWGLIVWFAGYWVNTEDKKFDLLFQSQKEIRQTALETSKCFNKQINKTCRGCDIC